ncbi:hypothetical protein CHS0354_010337 [Potamilus streckersoni]|uniref:Metalloendopeptidase n=1 Tax=Potamilus streckersoni TaxID=2493646 RepID=A0AAE0WCN8_9BIVA|nr:hypothetical protein CHS0354_010337 [Potamilus streckersoni]
MDFIHFGTILQVLAAAMIHPSFGQNETIDVNILEAIRLWPRGVIPYNLPQTVYGPKQRAKILAAMRRWEDVTCIKFVPWTDKMQSKFRQKRYINFFSAGNCFSRNGFHKIQPQLIGLGPKCLSMSTIVHELGHAIGLIHEMERPDRDSYINVLYDNINPDSRRNYDITVSKGMNYELYNTPYDYKSIMHYPPMAWSNNNGPAVITKDPAYQNVIGRVDEISFFNALYVNRAYSCQDQCANERFKDCQNGGFVGGPDCHCICTEGFGGELCDIVVPGYSHIVAFRCQTEWEFHEGKCYLMSSSVSLSYDNAEIYCGWKNASLVRFESSKQWNWLRKRVLEEIATGDKKTFWVGLTRGAWSELYQWGDDNDTSQLRIEDTEAVYNRACGKLNGLSPTVTNCEMDQDNGLICVKDFDPTCGGRHFISGTALSLHSPGYPDKYPENIECEYVLQARRKNKIEIRFQEFDIETHSACKSDYVEVKLTDMYKPGTRYCGKDLLNKTLVSDDNVLIVRLVSNARNSGAGFRFEARAIPPVRKMRTTRLVKRMLSESSQDDQERQG